MARTTLLAAILVAATTTVLTSVAPRAEACWDGYLANVGERVTLAGYDETWSVERAREVATWGARIDGLLPDGAKLEAWLGFVTLDAATVDDADASFRWDGASYAALFDQVAARLHSPWVVAHSARARTATVYTVQVGANADEAIAEAFAARTQDMHLGEHGFYEAGGFPNDNPTVHVVAATSPAGRPVYRVVVGAFLSASEANVCADALAKGGIRGFVRAI